MIKSTRRIKSADGFTENSNKRNKLKGDQRYKTDCHRRRRGRIAVLVYMQFLALSSVTIVGVQPVLIKKIVAK